MNIAKPIKFTVRCKLDNCREETLYVYYVKNDGKWLPLPPNICDHSDNSQTCQECIAKALNQALNEAPPFLK
jgi:hypothetical protein